MVKVNRFKKIKEWMKNEKYLIFLILAFLIIAGIRIVISLQSRNFSYAGYENLYYVKYLLEHGHPFMFDLGLGGEVLSFLPVYYYVLAFFGLFSPLWVVGKIIPNILASLIIFPTYSLVKEFSKNKKTSFFISLLVSFIPVYFVETINNVSPFSLVVPLIIFMFYFFIKLENKKYRAYFTIFALLSPLIHKSFFIVVLTLLIYLFLLGIEKVQLKRIERDYTLFFIFWFLWVVILIYKNVLIQNSFEILKNMFVAVPTLKSETNFLMIILLIGYIPFVNGLYSVYVHLFRIRNKILYLMISLILATVIMFISNGVSINECLIFIGFGLSIIFAEFYKTTFTSSSSSIIQDEKDKIFHTINKVTSPFWGFINKYKKVFALFFYITFILTAIVPSVSLSYGYTKSALTDEQLIPFELLKNETPGIVVSMSFEEGAIKYLSDKDVLIGGTSFFQRDLDQKMNDLFVIYGAKYETTALEALTYYDVYYIYESAYSKKLFGELDYTSNEKCFEKIYSGESSLYKVKCKLKTYR